MSATPRSWRRRLRRLPLLLFVATALLAMFFAGVLAGVFRLPLAHSAYQTLAVKVGLLDDGGEARRGGRGGGRVVRQPDAPTQADCAPWPASSRNTLKKHVNLPRFLCPAARVAAADAAAARIEFVVGGELDDPIVVKGEVGAFLDQCPAPWGCLAVEYSRAGFVSRAWPFRPEEIAAANIAKSGYPYHPYQHAVGWSFSSGLDAFHVAPYPGGDLAVVFHFKSSLPHGGGVARVAPDGRPRWYRKDYSHRRPHVLDDDAALVLGVRLRRMRLSHQVGPRQRGNDNELDCRDGKIHEDRVNVLGRHGDILEEISILDAIVGSRHAGRLVGAPPCDPIHLNFAHVLGDDAGGAAGIAPGDLVASLRNMSAFAILDKHDRRVKRLVRGSFHRQHGVRHLEKARFVLFDNLGTDAVHGPARLMTVDLATGRERTVFPNDATPEHLRDWFALVDGALDVSPDRRRVLLADPLGARAVEIRLADGRVLNVFRQIHDLSGLPGVPKELVGNAALFEFHGIGYANRW